MFCLSNEEKLVCYWQSIHTISIYIFSFCYIPLDFFPCCPRPNHYRLAALQLRKPLLEQRKKCLKENHSQLNNGRQFPQQKLQATTKSFIKVTYIFLFSHAAQGYNHQCFSSLYPLFKTKSMFGFRSHSRVQYSQYSLKHKVRSRSAFSLISQGNFLHSLQVFPFLFGAI